MKIRSILMTNSWRNRGNSKGFTFKSLLGKAPPYLSSLVTIATPIARAAAGIFHWSSPKPIPHLAASPSSSLLPMTGTNCKNHWSWILISPSLTLSISCQSSLPIIAPVHSPYVNSPPNYLIPILLFFCSFAPQYLYLNIHLLHNSNQSLFVTCARHNRCRPYSEMLTYRL